MASLTITIDSAEVREAIDLVQAKMSSLPYSERQRFMASWSALQGAGAEWVEVNWEGGRVVVRPTDDLIQLMAKFNLIE